jgi:hypothetical protein
MALDRDVDELFDLDEVAAGTDPENADTDADGFPDGYEVRWGMNPLQPSASSPDNSAPSLLSLPTLIYRTGTAIKLEFATDEEVRVHVRVDGTLVARLPLGDGQTHDREFQLVLGELEPGRSYAVELELVDPADNVRSRVFHYSTRPLVLGEAVRVTAIRPLLLPPIGGGRPQLDVAVHLRQGAAPASIGYAVTASVYHRREADGALTLVTTTMQPTFGGTDGRVLLRTEVPTAVELGGPGALLVTVQDVEAPTGAAPYVEALDAVGTVELPHP